MLHASFPKNGMASNIQQPEHRPHAQFGRWQYNVVTTSGRAVTIIIRTEDGRGYHPSNMRRGDGIMKGQPAACGDYHH
eukprot:scaffold34903_cov37-Cyclotella_meneghiniana.AAC.2